MLKAAPRFKTFLVPQGIRPCGTIFFLVEYVPEFENILGYEIGAQMGSIHEKNQRPTKISSYYPFKSYIQYSTPLPPPQKKKSR
jgi:hypothetical protein